MRNVELGVSNLVSEMTYSTFLADGLSPRVSHLLPSLSLINDHFSSMSTRSLKKMATMNQAWRYTRQGYPSQTLEKHTIPIPTPHSEEVIVEVKAVSLNPVDYKLYVYSQYLICCF